MCAFVYKYIDVFFLLSAPTWPHFQKHTEKKRKKFYQKKKNNANRNKQMLCATKKIK